MVTIIVHKEESTCPEKFARQILTPTSLFWSEGSKLSNTIYPKLEHWPSLLKVQFHFEWDTPYSRLKRITWRGGPLRPKGVALSSPAISPLWTAFVRVKGRSRECSNRENHRVERKSWKYRWDLWRFSKRCWRSLVNPCFSRVSCVEVWTKEKHNKRGILGGTCFGVVFKWAFSLCSFSWRASPPDRLTPNKCQWKVRRSFKQWSK